MIKAKDTETAKKFTLKVGWKCWGWVQCVWW